MSHAHVSTNTAFTTTPIQSRKSSSYSIHRRMIMVAQVVIGERRQHIAFPRDPCASTARRNSLQFCLQRTQPANLLADGLKLIMRDARRSLAGPVGVVLQLD